MNRRYILLSSTYRNRNEYPNPFQFVASYKSNNTLSKTNAFDWVSNNAPIVNYDLGDYFSATSGTGPYRWVMTGTITSPTLTTISNTFVIGSLAATINSVLPVSNQYIGLNFISPSTSNSEIIKTFTDNLDGTFTVVLENPVSYVEAGVDTFTIATNFLSLNQTYIPSPPLENVIAQDNAYNGLFLAEVSDTPGEIFEITDFDASTRVLTTTTDFAVFPIQELAITNKSTLTIYEVQSVSSQTITVDVVDQPTITTSTLIGQYIFHYSTGTTGQITNATELAGVITLTINANTDISAITATTMLGIVYYATDNLYPFDYQEPMRETQWQDRSQVRIYDLELLSVQLPNKLFKNYPGGYPVNYPYFFVDLENLSSNSRTDGVIYSNNPNVNRANFVCPVLDISTPQYSSFTKIDGGGIIYPYNIKANDSLKLTIRTPDGSIVETEDTDTSSPIFPDETLQVSALFAVTTRPTCQSCRY